MRSLLCHTVVGVILPQMRVILRRVLCPVEPEKPLDVIREAYQFPFAVDFFKAAKAKLAEAHRLLDDAEYRFHRLLPLGIYGAPCIGVELRPHVAKARIDYRLWGALPGRSEVVFSSLVGSVARWRHVGLDTVPRQLVKGIGVGVTGIGQHGRWRSHRLGHALHSEEQLSGIRGAVGDVRRHYELGAVSIYCCLAVIGLLVLALLALAHDPRIFIGQVDLFARGGGGIRGLGFRPFPTAGALLAVLDLLLVFVLLSFCPRGGSLLKLASGLGNLFPKRFSASDFFRQLLVVIRRRCVSRLSLVEQFLDLKLQLLFQFTRAFISSRRGTSTRSL